MKVVDGILTFPSNIDLDEGTRVKLATCLIAISSSLIDLGAHLKHAHWNLRGEGGFPAHKLFDKLYEVVVEQTDIIAERVGAIGCYVPGVLSVVEKLSVLPEYDLRVITPKGHYRELQKQLGMLCKHVRGEVKKVEKLDCTSANILQDLSAELDKALYFIELNIIPEIEV